MGTGNIFTMEEVHVNEEETSIIILIPSRSFQLPPLPSLPLSIALRKSVHKQKSGDELDYHVFFQIVIM